VIPALLWRCPLCAEPEALTHRRPYLRREVVSCTACGARWRVRRIAGDDFYLRLDRPSASHPMPAGQEYPLAAWYDRIKGSVRLESIQHPQIILKPGERLFLVSRSVELWAAADDPIISGKPVESHLLSSLANEDPDVYVGRGQIFLTSQRLAWQCDRHSQDFPLTYIQGAYAIVNLGMAVTSRLRLIFFRFLDESPLKWITYIDLVATQVLAETTHRIRTSHW